jgi:O-antigen/teichoic acid export membrane protein
MSWSLLESVGVQGVRFVVSVLLARLLFPEQFGLVGMLMVFIAVAQSFLDGGFSVALIQKRDATGSDYCSIFYFNVLVGAVAAGLLCMAAPWVAAFYHQPILTSLLRILSLTVVIDSLSLVQSTILAKRLDFETQTKVSLCASLLSGAVGVGCAVAGFGVWSLAFLQISAALARAVCLWLSSSWRPALLFSVTSLRTMLGFGTRMLFSNVLNQVFENIYLVVIGKLFSAADLGYFTRAKTLQELPASTLSSVVGRVTFPVFARIQDDPARLRRGMQKALTTLALTNFPMMIGLALVARPLVVTLLTDKWTPAVPYIQLLCATGMLYPLHVVNLNLLTALGRSDLFLRLELIKKTMVILNIVVTWRWGIAVMIWGMTSISLIAYYVNCYYSGRFVGYTVWQQLRDSSSYLLAALVMGVVTYWVGSLLSNPWAMLVAQVVVGAVTYMVLCQVFRLSAFLELRQHVRNSIQVANGATRA